MNLTQVRRKPSPLLMVALWLMVTPLALLALSVLVPPIFQVRYVIGILPAGALLVAGGLGALLDLPLRNGPAPGVDAASSCRVRPERLCTRR